MIYKKDKLTVEVLDTIYKFSGQIEASDYKDLEKFLKDNEAGIASDTITFDIIDLTYLNSSGIRVLAVFFLKSSKKIIVKMNPESTWQRISILPLAKMRKDGEITIVQE